MFIIHFPFVLRSPSEKWQQRPTPSCRPSNNPEGAYCSTALKCADMAKMGKLEREHATMRTQAMRTHTHSHEKTSNQNADGENNQNTHKDANTENADTENTHNNMKNALYNEW